MAGLFSRQCWEVWRQPFLLLTPQTQLESGITGVFKCFDPNFCSFSGRPFFQREFEIEEIG